MMKTLNNSVSRTWTIIYLRLLAFILLYGGLIHVGNILGFGEIPWQETPIHWQIMDIVLLIFDLTTSIGLWFKKTEAIIAFLMGIMLLQIVPYTIFRQYFITVPQDNVTLNGLIITELILIIILVTLIVLKK